MHALAPIAYIADMKSPLFRTLVLFLDFLTVRMVGQQGEHGYGEYVEN